jgi:hypothetical protein
MVFVFDFFGVELLTWLYNRVGLDQLVLVF